MTKLYITLSEKRCFICTRDYEYKSDTLTEDKRICPDCLELSKNRIALIVINPLKSDIDDNQPISLKNVYRTGNIIWLSKKTCKAVIPNIDIERYIFLFIDEEVEAKIKPIFDEEEEIRKFFIN